MTDITETLEARAVSYEQSGPSAHHTAALLREAKAEIEALRRDIACRPGALELEYRIREALGFNKYYPLSHIDGDVRKLKRVEQEARRLIKEGLRLTPDGVIVRENADNSDPHYALCTALDLIEPLNTPR